MNLRSGLRKFRRFTFIKLGRFLRSAKNESKIKRPKNLTHQENTAMQIFLEILHDKESKLYYDIATHECYISSPDKSIYIFLESRNI